MLNTNVSFFMLIITFFFYRSETFVKFYADLLRGIDYSIIYEGHSLAVFRCYLNGFNRQTTFAPSTPPIHFQHFLFASPGCRIAIGPLYVHAGFIAHHTFGNSWRHVLSHSTKITVSLRSLCVFFFFFFFFLITFEVIVNN